MKKEFFLFIFVIFFISVISALDIQINENASLGENVLMKVSGNFLENIQKSDISFNRQQPIAKNWISTSFVNYDVKKIGEDFYVYVMVDLNKIPDNYSIQIKGVQYMKGVEVSSETIIGNFSVLNKKADFSLIPGIIKTDSNFYVKIQNLQESNINLSVTDNQTTEYLFKSGETKNLYFNLGNGTRTINFESENQIYDLIADNPILLIEENVENNVTFNDSDENTTILVDENITERDNNTILDENKSENNNTQNETKDAEDILIVDNETGEVKTCAELGGSVCNSEKPICEGEKQTSDGAECCLGKCVEKKSNNSKKVVGWVLIGIIVLIFLWFFLKKYKGTKKKGINLEKESKGKVLPPLPPPKHP